MAEDWDEVKWDALNNEWHQITDLLEHHYQRTLTAYVVAKEILNKEGA